MRKVLAVSSICLVLAAIAASGQRSHVTKDGVRIADTAPRALSRPGVLASPTSAETLVVATFTFDGPGGVPDTQGWTTHDLSTDVDTFFHVADTTELDGGDFGLLTVLEGNQSLWCGATYDTHPELCNYASLPGYGAFWDQSFRSRVFPRSGDVGISYLVQYDNEGGYDRTTIYYRDVNGYWNGADYFEGQGSEFRSVVVPDSALADSVQFLLRFKDSAFWNDETGLANLDGAVIFDSLTIWDATGIVDFEDFEDEVPGARATADGDWTAFRAGDYGTFAALFDGSTVLQEDSLVTNTTNLWGFFSGSTADYSCAGNPGQPAVPYFKPGPPFGDETYINNEIWSPVIDWTQDENGNAIGSWVDGALLVFDVYRDLDLDALVFYTWRVRTVTDGCGDDWQDDNQVRFGADKDWFRASFDLSPYVTPGTQAVQVALGVVDRCYWWCGTFGDGDCHSHAPLFDNVQLLRFGPTASAAGETPSVTSLGENFPNPFNPATTIPFSLSTRSHVRVEVYDVAGRLVRTLVDGAKDAGAAHSVEWDGRDTHGRPVASGVYFVTLTTGAFEQTRKVTLLK